MDRVLGFDPDDGAFAVLDDKGQPRRIDLRATEVRLASRDKLSSITSVNGSDIFGITATGNVTRLSPVGDWNFEPPSPARWVFPQPNGSIVIAGIQGAETHLWLVRPPDDDIVASAQLPAVSRGIRTRVGDRIYFTVDSGLIGVLTRDLSPVKSVRLDAGATAVVPTPSGDRLYAALEGKNEIAVVDRYTQAVATTVKVPGRVIDLRMDPLGQYVLARPVNGDSVWVIAVANNEVSGTLRSEWRNDLPAFAPGSAIATARGDDVAFVNPSNLRDMQTVAKGASDFWYFFAWNGFRPRLADLDQPVTFDSAPSAEPAPDSMVPGSDSLPQPTVRDASPTLVPPPPPPVPAQRNYVVSFAAVLSEQKANEVAAGIAVNGVRPHVASAPSGSTTIYRVVLGPYNTREEADRVGRDSKRQYWIYEESR